MGTFVSYTVFLRKSTEWLWDDKALYQGDNTERKDGNCDSYNGIEKRFPRNSGIARVAA